MQNSNLVEVQLMPTLEAFTVNSTNRPIRPIEGPN